MLAAQLQALVRGARLEGPSGELVVALGALGERPLGAAAALGDGSQLAFDARASRARGLRALLGVRELQAPRAQRLARELQACFEQLALQALVQLGGLGLALERTQPAARLALDVERAIEVLLCALQLQLRAAAALAVLAETCRLLDQQAPIARLGGHDALDAALRDNRVGLLAETGVGEHLDHVDQPAARAVESVLALARAVQAPQDRDLADRQRDGAIGVVEHDLDLRRAARLHTASAAEDHVLHRLPAHRERRLLAHRPQDGVGDVGLARAVGADDNADPGPEVQARAIRKGLEALQG